MLTEQELTVTLTESGQLVEALMEEVVAISGEAGVTTQRATYALVSNSPLHLSAPADGRTPSHEVRRGGGRSRAPHLVLDWRRESPSMHEPHKYVMIKE